MRLHPRHDAVTAADLEIRQAITAAVEKHKLTFAELTMILANSLAWDAKYEIRSERADDGGAA
jgi:hypothetical protein